MGVLQSKLSIAGMSYSVHLVRANTFQWKRPNHGQTLIEKNPIQRTRLQRRISIADTTFWRRVKISNQIYLFIADTPYFLWKNKNKLLFNFKMFLFDTLLSFSTIVLTLLYLVSHQEFTSFLNQEFHNNFLRELGP